jgi:hypothetical protein
MLKYVDPLKITTFSGSLTSGLVQLSEATVSINCGKSSGRELSCSDSNIRAEVDESLVAAPSTASELPLTRARWSTRRMCRFDYQSLPGSLMELCHTGHFSSDHLVSNHTKIKVEAALVKF